MRIAWIMIVLLMSGCGEVFAPPVASDPIRVKAMEAKSILPTLAGRTVSEMTLLVFREELDRGQWASLLRMTRELSSHREAIRKNQGRTLDASEQEIQDRRLARVTEIIGLVYEEYSVYLLNWGQAENCVVRSDFWLKCDPLYDVYGENPLNGGNPKSILPLQVARGPFEKTDSVLLALESVVPDYGDFRVRAYLKPETSMDGVFLQGDLVVDPGSSFIFNGERRRGFRYGYLELRFAPATF